MYVTPRGTAVNARDAAEALACISELRGRNLYEARVAGPGADEDRPAGTYSVCVLPDSGRSSAEIYVDRTELARTRRLLPPGPAWAKAAAVACAKRSLAADIAEATSGMCRALWFIGAGPAPPRLVDPRGPTPHCVIEIGGVR